MRLIAKSLKCVVIYCSDQATYREFKDASADYKLAAQKFLLVFDTWTKKNSNLENFTLDSESVVKK